MHIAPCMRQLGNSNGAETPPPPPPPPTKFPRQNNPRTTVSPSLSWSTYFCLSQGFHIGVCCPAHNRLPLDGSGWWWEGNHEHFSFVSVMEGFRPSFPPLQTALSSPQKVAVHGSSAPPESPRFPTQSHFEGCIAGLLQRLIDMGFAKHVADKALRTTDDDLDLALSICLQSAVDIDSMCAELDGV